MSAPHRGPDEGPLTLHEAADSLGLHYMTVYRYVRTGQLAATREGGQWRVTRADVEALRTRPPAAVGRRAAGRTAATGTVGESDPERVERLAERLVAGDGVGAWAIVQRALASGAEPRDAHLELLCPALDLVGERWANGSWTVAQEHRATAEANRVVGRLGPLFRRPGRKVGTVVIGAAPGDRHALPVAIAADLLRDAGFDVVDLGADTPAASFVEAAHAAESLVAVSMCVSTAVSGAAAKALRRDVRHVVESVEAPLVLGGRAVPSPEAAHDLGAPAWSGSAPDLVQWCRSRARSTPSRTGATP